MARTSAAEDLSDGYQDVVKQTPRRALEASVWNQGVLFWMLRPHQVPLYEAIMSGMTDKSPAAGPYVLCVCRRFGKSSTLALIAIEQCLKNPGFVVRMVAPFLKMAREIAHEVVLPFLEPASHRPKWNSVDSFYEFRNGSKIFINGANNGHEDDSRGRKADLCLVDEAGYIDRLPYIVNDVLTPQLLESGHIGAMILSSTPPVTADHPFKEYRDQSMLAGRYSEYTIDDNTYLEQHVKDGIAEQFGGRDSTAFRREFMCEFVVESSRAIVPDWGQVAAECTVDAEPDPEYGGFYDRYVSMDLGVVHYTVILFGYYDYRRAVLVVEHEEFLKGEAVRSDRIADIVKSREEGKPKPYLRIADNNELILLNDLQQHGLYFRATNKDSLHAMVNDMRLWVKAKRVLINPSCKMLLGCLEGGIWDKNRAKWEESSNYGHYDALAALMYMIRNVDESRNPIPATHGFTSRATQWLDPARVEMRRNLNAKLAKLTATA